ncbi:MAG: exopolysaccharide biosynthesis protein [Pseudorhizobium sp.]
MAGAERLAGCAGGVASATLRTLADEAVARKGLTIGEALETMGRSGFGFVMLLLSLPAMIPVPGPFGLVFGSALAIVALQFAFGVRALWLPAFLKNRRVSARAFELLQHHASPMVGRIERLVRPGRLKALTGPRLPFILALPVFALAVAVALPIPFGNLAPVAAICVMAVGLVERDGLVVMLGLLLTLIALSITVVLLHGAASIVALI